MGENSTLNDLARKLKQSKERDLKQVQQIEEQKLSELSQRLHERLSKELSIIEEDMQSKSATIMRTTIKNMSDMHQRMIQEDEKFISMQQKMLDKSRENTREMRTQWDDLYRKKTNHAWVWVVVFSMWTAGMVMLGSFLSQNPQIFKSDIAKSTEEITMKQVNEYLNQGYEIEETATGEIILTPKRGE